jgi:hypothetical protein
MIIAALIVFGTLLAAWLLAPAEPRPSRTDVQLAPLEGLAEAA